MVSLLFICVIRKKKRAYKYYKHMAGPGIECSNPATLFRSSTTEIPRPIFTVHIAPTATYEFTE